MNLLKAIPILYFLLIAVIVFFFNINKLSFGLGVMAYVIATVLDKYIKYRREIAE